MSHGGSTGITPGTFSSIPGNKFVSEFVGMPNIIECDRSRILTSGLVEVVSDEMTMVLPYDGGNIRKISIPPDDIYIYDVKPPGPALNRFTGKVEEISRHGSNVRVRVSIGKNGLLAELPASAFDELSLEEGGDVHVVIKLRRLRYVNS